MRGHWWFIGLLAMAAAAICWYLRPSSAPHSASVQAAEQSPILVELFTSEGCSSCPPADALLREWNGRSTASGRKVIGLSEHVTYWNALGWSDPYSSDAFTDRQNGYGERFHLDSVYTPQLVINGRTQLVASRRAEVLAALDTQPPYPLTLALQSTRQMSDHMDVVARITGDLPTPDADLFAAVTDDMDQTEVKRGENAGETLHHAAVVRQIARIGRVHSDGTTITYRVPLPASVHADRMHGHHVVLFAQAPRFGEIYGADTLPLQ